MPAKRGGHDAYQWADYVIQVMGSDRQVDVSRKTGVSQGTVSRWLSGERVPVTHTAALALARVYHRPVLEALTMAGILSPEETGIDAPLVLTLRDVSTNALLDELRRRHGEGRDGR